MADGSLKVSISNTTTRRLLIIICKYEHKSDHSVKQAMQYKQLLAVRISLALRV
jgi:hypothetical protein